MYNRYIPQSDGSYRRRSVPDRKREASRIPPLQQHQEPDCNICPPAPPPRHERCIPPPRAGSYLRNLLPAELDTEDLLVIVLLLLMTGEGRNDSGLPLLTLALYLFL